MVRVAGLREGARRCRIIASDSATRPGRLAVLNANENALGPKLPKRNGRSKRVRRAVDGVQRRRLLVPVEAVVPDCVGCWPIASSVAATPGRRRSSCRRAPVSAFQPVGGAVAGRYAALIRSASVSVGARVGVEAELQPEAVVVVRLEAADAGAGRPSAKQGGEQLAFVLGVAGQHRHLAGSWPAAIAAIGSTGSTLPSAIGPRAGRGCGASERHASSSGVAGALPRR